MKSPAGLETVAVLVGADVNGLGVIRSLAAAGIPLLKMDTDPRRPGMRSRHGRAVVVHSLEGESLVSSLLDLAARLSRPPVLFLTEEASVRTVSRHRDRLRGRYLFRLPAHDLLMRLMDKPGFHALAGELGVPLPGSVDLSSEADLKRLEDLRFPCILKPAYKDYEYGARFKKAYRVGSADEVEQLYREIAPVLPDMVVQEWIEGDDDQIYFCLQYRGGGGETVASFVGRKLRSWPPRVGGTASCTAAPEMEEEVRTATDRLLDPIAYEGMVGVEFKRDRRDGRLYLVEPTVARTDFQSEVATLNGVNLPAVQYFHETGGALPPVRVPVRPRMWREPLDDRWAAQMEPDFQPHLPRGGVWVDAYWRWNDPRPWLDLQWQRLREKWQALTGGA
jgi:predicted ATP-grasp superfamily ATP-dependent carboligase